MKLPIACALLLAAAAARAELTSTLAAEPASVQAGIPASLILTVTNGGDAPVKLPPFVALTVRKDDGASFTVTEGTRYARPIPNDLVTLAPHATTTTRWDPEGSWSMPWFGDARLTVPGTYKISAHFLEKADSELRGTAASAPATLTVTAPAGDDAAVCKAARERSPKAPAGSCPVRVLLLDAADRAFWAQHRASAYTAFFVGAIPAPLPEQIAALEAFLARAPNDPIADWRRIYLGKLENLAAGEASAAKDIAAAKAHAARAMAFYKRVASQGRLPDARKRAAFLADDLDKQMTASHWR